MRRSEEKRGEERRGEERRALELKRWSQGWSLELVIAGWEVESRSLERGGWSVNPHFTASQTRNQRVKKRTCYLFGHHMSWVPLTIGGCPEHHSYLSFLLEELIMGLLLWNGWDKPFPGQVDRNLCTRTHHQAAWK